MYKDPKLQVIYNTENTRVYERVTLNFMRAHALQHEENQKYWYLHTKGLMLYHLIKNYDTCIQILD